MGAMRTAYAKSGAYQNELRQTITGGMRVLWKESARIVCEQHFISLISFDEPGGKCAFEMRHFFLCFFSLVRMFVHKFLVYLRTLYASPLKPAHPLNSWRFFQLIAVTFWYGFQTELPPIPPLVRIKLSLSVWSWWNVLWQNYTVQFFCFAKWVNIGVAPFGRVSNLYQITWSSRFSLGSPWKTFSRQRVMICWICWELCWTAILLGVLTLLRWACLHWLANFLTYVKAILCRWFIMYRKDFTLIPHFSLSPHLQTTPSTHMSAITRNTTNNVRQGAGVR